LVAKAPRVVPGEDWRVHYTLFARGGFTAAACTAAALVQAQLIDLDPDRDRRLLHAYGRRPNLLLLTGNGKPFLEILGTDRRRDKTSQLVLAMQITNAISVRINNRFFYGWVMLGVAAVGMFATGPGQSYTFSVFIIPLSEDLGISHTSVSSAYAIATLAAAFGLPYVGHLVDRFGVRLMMICITFLFGLSAMGFGAVTNLLLLAVGFGVLRFLGQGSLMLSCTNLVAQWFSRKRGLAMSLMGFGFSLSIATYPPLAQWLTDQFGWRQAWFWQGVFTWVLVIPLAVVLIKNKPEDIGLLPDGASKDAPSPGKKAEAAAELTASASLGFTLREALRTPAFWLIACALGVLFMLITGMFFHQISIFESYGLSPQTAANIFPLTAVSMIISMPILGHLLDRFSTRLVFVAGLVCMTCASITLAFVQGIISAVLYSVIFGIANAAILTNSNYIWPSYFGRKHLGSIQGGAHTIRVLGTSLGALPLGIAYDVFGGYKGALLLLSGLPLICIILVLLAKPPHLTADA
jgi:MFS family permease